MPSNETEGELASPLLDAITVASVPIRQPRILDREGRFSQSRGRWSVANTERGVRYRRGGALPPPATPPPETPPSPPAPQSLCNKLFPCMPSRRKGDTVRSCWDDWFHTISYTPTFLLLGIIFLAYFCTIVAFAGLYYGVNKLGVYYGHSDNGGEVINGGNGVPPISTFAVEGEGVDSFCGMDVNSFMEALYFSLSTMATIGYGTSDYYFGNCWTPFFLVLLQVFSALAFSSLAIGLLFQRMSRGQKRGRTIVFSDVAVIRKVRGQWHFMFRVAELRKRHIIGAKIRAFCVRHERCAIESKCDDNIEKVQLETAYFVSHPLSILTGTKSGGSDSVNFSNTTSSDGKSDRAYEQSILMGLPHVVVHRIDETSPISPLPVWYDEKGSPHVESNQGSGNQEQTPASPLASIEEGLTTTIASSEQNISEFLRDRHAEIIVFLEGTCEVTGMTLQARHSYKCEDIVFNHTFAPCVFPASSGSRLPSEKWWKGKSKVEDITQHTSSSLAREEIDLPHQLQPAALEVDFGQFHELAPAPRDCVSCPYVPLSAASRAVAGRSC